MGETRSRRGTRWARGQADEAKIAIHRIQRKLQVIPKVRSIYDVHGKRRWRRKRLLRQSRSRRPVVQGHDALLVPLVQPRVSPLCTPREVVFCERRVDHTEKRGLRHPRSRGLEAVLRRLDVGHLIE